MLSPQEKEELESRIKAAETVHGSALRAARVPLHRLAKAVRMLGHNILWLHGNFHAEDKQQKERELGAYSTPFMQNGY